MAIDGERHGRGDVQIRVRHHAGEDQCGRDIEHRADREARDDAERHVAARIPGLLGAGRDGIEADESEEHDAGPGEHAAPANWHPFVPANTGHFGHFGWSGVFAGAGIMFFAFIGFDTVSTCSEEARNPRRDVPLGIVSSLAICSVLYVATALVLTGLVPYAA